MRNAIIIVLLAGFVGGVTHIAEMHLFSGSPYFVIGVLTALAWMAHKRTIF